MCVRERKRPRDTERPKDKKIECSEDVGTERQLRTETEKPKVWKTERQEERRTES